jgi:hypothetical protein
MGAAGLCQSLIVRFIGPGIMSPGKRRLHSVLIVAQPMLSNFFSDAVLI